MAAGNDKETLRKQALEGLQEGRDEMATEVLCLRRELNPRRLAEQVMRRHGSVLIAGATAAGAGIALLLLRSKHDGEVSALTQGPARKQAGAVGGSLRTLIELALPSLLKKALDSVTKDLLAKQNPVPLPTALKTTE